MVQQAVLELPLDEELLKVLSSDTRREILRLLAERRMTGSELANRLGLGKPAVAEHLKRLTDVELIVRLDDPDRKWVYYELSPRGRSLLEPQRVRFYLVLGIAAIALALGVALAFGLQAAMDNLGNAETLQGEETGLAEGGLGTAAGTGSGVGDVVGPPVPDATPPPDGPAPSVLGPITLRIAAFNATGDPQASAVPENGTFEILLDSSTPGSDPTPEGLVVAFATDQIDAENGTIEVQAVSVSAVENATLSAVAPAPSPNATLPSATPLPRPSPSLSPSPSFQAKLVCTTVALPETTPSPTSSPTPPLPGLTPFPTTPAPVAPKAVVVCNVVHVPVEPVATAVPSTPQGNAAVPASPSLTVEPVPPVSPVPADLTQNASSSPTTTSLEGNATASKTAASTPPAATPTPSNLTEATPTAPRATDAASKPASIAPAPTPSPTPTPAPLSGIGAEVQDAEGRSGFQEATDGSEPSGFLEHVAAPGFARPILWFLSVCAVALALARWGPGGGD